MKCFVEASGSCQARCEEGTRFTASCNAQCAGRCSQSATADCRADCVDACSSSCQSGSFDCSADCSGRCNANCDTKCGDDDTCKTKCSASCTAQCSAKCEPVTPDLSCADSCASSCEGVCTALANQDCEVDCDGSCRVDLRGKCEASCKNAHAAVFCDGQYLNAQVNVDNCVSYLKGFHISIDEITEATLGCKANECVTEVKNTAKKTSSGCTVASGADGGMSGSLAALCIAGVTAITRRRSASRAKGGQR